jgi:hypothetical protein
VNRIMQSRSTLIAAVGAVVVTAALAPTSLLYAARSHTARAAAADTRVVKRIHVVERELATPMIDLGKPGPSLGDRGTITSVIENTHGTAIGRADFDCVATALGKRAGGTCTAVVTLPGGQITGAFFESFNDNDTAAIRQPITGGSGAYEGARGQFVVGKRTTAATPVTIELVR